MNRRDIIAETVKNSFNVHDEYKDRTIEELQEICRKESLGYRVCALNIEGDMNIGVMVRTASLLGCEKFYIFGSRKYDRRSAVGAQNYLPVERIAGLTDNDNLSLAKFERFIEKENVFPIFIEQGPNNLNSIDWSWVDLNPNPCFVFGNESTGIPKNFLDLADVNCRKAVVVNIPQLGVLRSYNVSSAASIVMWEYYRWRMSEKGSVSGH
jgi:tRNA G18 (ribose-2'-O)-methylase SpoU